MFEKDSGNSVIQAEVLFIKFLMQCNIPMAAADTFNRIVKTMFPDSEIH